MTRPEPPARQGDVEARAQLTPTFQKPAPRRPGTPDSAPTESLAAVRARLMPTVQYPDDVREHIAELQAMTDQDFREELADNILDQVPEVTAAFHSDELAERTLAATVFLLKQISQSLRRRSGESDRDWQKRAGYFQTAVGAERQRAKVIVEGLRARQGWVSNAPNPRSRAARELQSMYPVEYLELVRKHEAIIAAEEAERKAAKKRAANAKKKAKRAAQQGR